jgi:hypothetical protein
MHGSGSKRTKTATLEPVATDAGEVLRPAPASAHIRCWSDAECGHGRVIRARCTEDRCECAIETSDPEERRVYRFVLRDACSDMKRVLHDQCGATWSNETQR